jgi:DNA-directed RNA polymerase subunit RPC12/RpoP
MGVFMQSKNLQQCIEKEKAANDIREMIMLIQICNFCGKQFTFKRGRKQCPYCEELLRTKIIVQKALPSPLTEPNPL